MAPFVDVFFHIGVKRMPERRCSMPAVRDAVFHWECMDLGTSLTRLNVVWASDTQTVIDRYLPSSHGLTAHLCLYSNYITNSETKNTIADIEHNKPT